jgi:hypothetical protein
MPGLMPRHCFSSSVPFGKAIQDTLALFKRRTKKHHRLLVSLQSRSCDYPFMINSSGDF